MKNMGMLMALAGMGAMSGYPDNNFRDTRSEDIPFEPKQPVIPKGCKEYWFDIDGCYPNWAGRDQVVFKCIAISEKSAIRKFNKWKLKNVT